MINKSRKTPIITLSAIIYILLAFGWWWMLLLRKNKEYTDEKLKVVKLQMKLDSPNTHVDVFNTSSDYITLMDKYDRQRNMILGEGSIIFLGLLLGIWYIIHSFKKEVALTNQRRNFLLSITHELKSPIASIQLVLQTFQKRKLDEKQAEMLLNSAYKEADRLNELVNNLLLSAKLETTYEPYIEEINVAHLLNDIVSKLHIRFPNAEFKFDAQEVPILRGDKQGLFSIFTNLLENAIKYSSPSAFISIKYLYENNNFIFCISDNGMGISSSEKKKVFEKFYRVGNEETRKTKGTGLGLYIVAQIIKAHKGTIQIFDNQPSGTTFKIVLPNP